MYRDPDLYLKELSFFIGAAVLTGVVLAASFGLLEGWRDSGARDEPRRRGRGPRFTHLGAHATSPAEFSFRGRRALDRPHGAAAAPVATPRPARRPGRVFGRPRWPALSSLPRHGQAAVWDTQVPVSKPRTGP